MAEYLPIRALNRSQQVRIAGARVTSTATSYVDISDATVRKEYNHHATLGAVFAVGPISAVAAAPAAGSAVRSQEVTFTESTGAGIWTGAIVVPAGGTIIDIVVTAVAVWNSQTSATLKVGDTDDDGFFTAVDLMATDLTIGQSLSLAATGGQAGVYFINADASGDDADNHWTNLYSATAHTINSIVTKVGSSGTLGRTRVTVVYSAPISTDITAATKV